MVKRIRIPTHRSHDAGGAIWPGKVPLLDHLVSEAVGTNGLGEKLWRARGHAAPRYREGSKSLQALAMPRVNVDDNDLGLHNNQPLGSQGGFALYAEFPLG